VEICYDLPRFAASFNHAVHRTRGKHTARR
jgi:hypothetical protein